MTNPAFEQLKKRLLDHLNFIYQDISLNESCESIADKLIDIMRLCDIKDEPEQYINHWDQTDTVLITYGDSILENQQHPLHSLLHFLDEHTENLLTNVHILPFFPFSTDDGFSVVDFYQVRDSLGDWTDIKHIAEKYRLMADLVINHCSAKSTWFKNFISQTDPGKDYFFTASPDADLSKVVRPRTNSLLLETHTTQGKKHVWCTFSPDQVDLDFRNPNVLLEFTRIIRCYLDNGVKIFRLDAIAFLWKIAGTRCINLPQTHEVVRLLRTLIEHAAPNSIILTETNIPNRENLEYFGNNNEAHWIYNFALPPLLLNTLLTGSSHYLKQWLMGMPPAQNGTTYFNFIASHDGIGLRPIEGILSEDEVNKLISTMKAYGGEVSWRALDNGVNKPYEINISLFDALKGTIDGEDTFGEARFICAHAIMFGLEGVPAIYIHSLLAKTNDYALLEKTGHKRSINRHQWQYPVLKDALNNSTNHHYRIFNALKHLLAIRRKQKALHPNATQFTLHLGDSIFAFWRQSIDRQQNIFCISNISKNEQTIKLSSINLINTVSWRDLISKEAIDTSVDEIILSAYQTRWICNS